MDQEHKDMKKLNARPQKTKVKHSQKTVICLGEQLKSELHLSAAWTDDINQDVPSKWEIIGDLLLLPDNSFQHQIWNSIGCKVWQTVAEITKCQRVAKVTGHIVNNNFRSPKVELLFGSNGWVERTENGIKYSYDITKCMFSKGNITEKLRIAAIDCSHETVVDMYAGIGYFTLPYLVHSRAKRVYACEWNPHAADALRRNLVLNKVDQCCIVLEGDNAECCPRGVAQRVNLGLIPSSEAGWPVACRALDATTGGVLHIHANVESSPTASGKLLTTPSRQPWTDLSVEQIPPASDCDCELAVRQFVVSELCKSRASNNVLCNANINSAHSEPKERKFKKKCAQQDPWLRWACGVQITIDSLLSEMHGVHWTCRVIHIEHVKSYAPHIDHLVVDLMCTPPSTIASQ